MAIIYENPQLKIETEESEIPWVKLFTQHPYKEMSEVPAETRFEIYDLLDMIEKAMIAYYTPDKINIASFGNYMPHVHWHIMARFREDMSRVAKDTERKRTMSEKDREKWNRKYTEKPTLLETRPPSPMLVSHLHLVNGKCALDLACGSGRHTRFLSEKGFCVDAGRTL